MKHHDKFLKFMSWQRRLFKKRLPAPPNLPVGTRFQKRGDDEVCDFIIIERPPQTRTILTVFGYDGENKWFLGFPYSVFCIKYTHNEGNYYSNNLWVGFSDKSLLSGADMIYRMPLANYIGDCGMRVCMGGMTYNLKFTSLNEMVDDIISLYWSSYFTGYTPLPDNLDDVLGKKTPKKWRELTKNKQSLKPLLSHGEPLCREFPSITSKTIFING